MPIHPLRRKYDNYIVSQSEFRLSKIISLSAGRMRNSSLNWQGECQLSSLCQSLEGEGCHSIGHQRQVWVGETYSGISADRVHSEGRQNVRLKYRSSFAILYTRLVRGVQFASVRNSDSNHCPNCGKAPLRTRERSG